MSQLGDEARAAIDIGSNSLLLTVLDSEGTVLHDEARVVGLGKGLGDRGLFAPDRMKEADIVLGDYVAISKKHGINPWHIRAAATSGARRAMNAPTWLARVRRNLGLRVDIVSGEEEARLTWVGATADVAADGTLLVVDLGGGSTELVFGTKDDIIWRKSLEVGSVRLTEQFIGVGAVDADDLFALRNHIDIAMAELEIATPSVVIGVAGTVTTLAAMAQGITVWDADRVHGTNLSRKALLNFIEQLVVMTPEARREAVAVSPKRADFLLAGACILDRVLTAAKADGYRVSDRGLRYGLLHGDA
jgi:exopolyphosphatase / guanosine-5'-triphosphate,3'-diphosphate pyrophosphatase